ncbi:MAG: hypothetical protein ABWX92_05100 [Mycetocola sp.]
MTQHEIAMKESQEITVVVYEEIESTYRVPLSRFRELNLPETRDELSDTTELQFNDIDVDTLMDALEGIEPIEYAVQERRMSFPTDD